MNAKNTILHVEDIVFSYGEKQLLQEVSFFLAQGEITTLVGSSGTGKTTLLKLIAGIFPLQKGRILGQNKEPIHSSSRVGYMSQEDALLPWRTVFENVLLPCELGVNAKESIKNEEKTQQVLTELGLWIHKDKYPDELSGGMRKLVSFARICLLEKELLLLDEPFGSIDVHLREALFKMLRKLRFEKKVTIFFVTHDFRDACLLSDRILMLSCGKLVKEWAVPEGIHQSPEKQGVFQEEIRQSFAYFHPFSQSVDL